MRFRPFQWAVTRTTSRSRWWLPGSGLPVTNWTPLLSGRVKISSGYLSSPVYRCAKSLAAWTWTLVTPERGQSLARVVMSKWTPI